MKYPSARGITYFSVNPSYNTLEGDREMTHFMMNGLTAQPTDRQGVINNPPFLFEKRRDNKTYDFGGILNLLQPPPLW